MDDTVFNSMAHAGDIILFVTNVQDLQNLNHICVEGGCTNLGLKNQNARLLENFCIPRTKWSLVRNYNIII
jgi:hypothetical protein